MNVLRPYEQRLRMELYEAGLNDREMAEKLFVSRRAVAYWRAACGLKPNGVTGRLAGKRSEVNTYE